jgi:hypothetical protein
MDDMTELLSLPAAIPILAIIPVVATRAAALPDIPPPVLSAEATPLARLARLLAIVDPVENLLAELRLFALHPNPFLRGAVNPRPLLAFLSGALHLRPLLAFLPGALHL